MSDIEDQGAKAANPFRIFRKGDGPALEETGAMQVADMAPVIAEGVGRWAVTGVEEGYVTRVLFSTPQMSLTHAWFKSDFPLPLHSHDTDCLYYVVAGSLKMGNEVLHAGDGFFVGKDVPYAYKPGPEGVEVLEFRTADEFDIKFKGASTAYWDKIVSGMESARGGWQDQMPPSERSAH